ncbi:autoinducer binding domain-containing protein [Pandoraea anhela]|nr:autoinducer binding domain-containing protein [Pandoraea anhela]
MSSTIFFAFHLKLRRAIRPRGQHGDIHRGGVVRAQGVGVANKNCLHKHQFHSPGDIMSALMHLLETIHDDCNGITDSQKLFQQIDSFSKRIGFEFCSYGFRHHRTATQSEVRVFDSYPAGWMAHYSQKGFLEIDPTVVVGGHSERLLSWRDPSLPRADELWRDAGDFGLNHGVARSSWGPYGEFGLLSF